MHPVWRCCCQPTFRINLNLQSKLKNELDHADNLLRVKRLVKACLQCLDAMLLVGW